MKHKHSHTTAVSAWPHQSGLSCRPVRPPSLRLEHCLRGVRIEVLQTEGFADAERRQQLLSLLRAGASSTGQGSTSNRCLRFQRW